MAMAIITINKCSSSSISGTLCLAPARRCSRITASSITCVATVPGLILGYGLAPLANKKATMALKLQDRDSGLQTGDLAGFTGTDTLACNAMGHIIDVDLVLGLKATNVI